MGKRAKKRNWRDKARRQQQLRRQRNERAFLFDAQLSRCLADIERTKWELFISLSGGNVAEAATLCGIEGVPAGARALWGRSAEDALSTYRGWLNRKKK